MGWAFCMLINQNTNDGKKISEILKIQDNEIKSSSQATSAEKSILNEIKIGGFKLGFWFAQQGSIYVFVGLIFYYAWSMNRIDKEYKVSED